MESLEASCEDGERALKKKKLWRSSSQLLRHQDSVDAAECSSSKPSFCIFTKLLELHKEECAKEINQTNKTGIKTNSHLLDKVVARERLNTLTVNLHPGNKGYSLEIPLTARDQSSEDTANMIETIPWPYENEHLLGYINKEELPPHLLKLLDNFTHLFYSGCVIAQVRDYRQAYPHFNCDIHHVLLRPTLQSILADINNMADDKDWTNEDRLQLESQLLLSNSPSLCLDPDPSISQYQFRMNHNHQAWNTHKFRRTARKYSQPTVNRKRKLDQFTHRHGLVLYDFLTRAKTKSKTGQPHSIANKLTKKIEEIKPIVVPNLDSPLLSPPSQGVVINEFKPFHRSKETSNCLPQLLEEYVLETDMASKDKGKPRVYHIKLSIMQRPSNLEYLGELYLDRDHKKNERNGVACRFSLGTKAHAQKYVQQFTEIFTESGRKSVRIRYGVTPGYNKGIAVAQAHAQAQAQAQNAAQANMPQFQISHFGHGIQTQSCASTPQVNGTVGQGINLVQQNQNLPNTSSVPILQSHLQANSQIKSSPQPISNQELEINALATKLMNSAQQFQAAANAKQQQQKLAASGNNTAIINLLNSSPASTINSDASAAVVNAINNSSILPQQVQINQKLLGRKMTLSNIANARVLNHSNLIAVNNNRMNISDINTQLGQQQSQTITLTPVNSSGNYTNYTTVPIKQQVVNQRIINSSSDNKALSALLVGTPAADRPDIVGPNTNSLLLEKFAGSSTNHTAGQATTTHFIQSPKSGQQYMVQSPKGNTVMSPLSSPPPQNTNTINVQSLNFTQLQSISGLQNVQVQLPGFAQPISLSLNVSSTGNIQAHPTSLIVSLPVTTPSSTSNTITQSAGNTGNIGDPIGVGTPTVVLTNTGTPNLAQLVTSGVKGLTQQGIRATGPTAVTLSQGGQPFHLLAPLQRPRVQQTGIQQNLTTRTLQRTPITIKMAAPNTNAATTHLQKQAQLQYQQLCLGQQNLQGVAGKVRRLSNNSEPQ